MKMILRLLLLMIGSLLIISGQAQANEAPMQRHTVVKGDRLIKIAQQFPETNWVSIAKVNKLKNPDLVYPGQVLIIPILTKSDVVVKNSPSLPAISAPQAKKSTQVILAQKSTTSSQMKQEKSHTAKLKCTGMGKEARNTCIATQKTRGVHAGKKSATPKLASSSNMSHRQVGNKIAKNRTVKSADMDSSRDRYTTAPVVVPPEPTLGDVANHTYLQLKSALEEVIDRPDLDVTPLVKVLYEKYRENGNSMPPTISTINEKEGDYIAPHTE